MLFAIEGNSCAGRYVNAKRFYPLLFGRTLLSVVLFFSLFLVLCITVILCVSFEIGRGGSDAPKPREVVFAG